MFPLELEADSLQVPSRSAGSSSHCTGADGNREKKQEETNSVHGEVPGL
jgi:hypothetical protein